MCNHLQLDVFSKGHGTKATGATYREPLLQSTKEFSALAPADPLSTLTPPLRRLPSHQSKSCEGMLLFLTEHRKLLFTNKLSPYPYNQLLLLPSASGQREGDSIAQE